MGCPYPVHSYFQIFEFIFGNKFQKIVYFIAIGNSVQRYAQLHCPLADFPHDGKIIFKERLAPKESAAFYMPAPFLLLLRCLEDALHHGWLHSLFQPLLAMPQAFSFKTVRAAEIAVISGHDKENNAGIGHKLCGKAGDKQDIFKLCRLVLDSQMSTLQEAFLQGRRQG